jgi:hypothetical protein
VSRWNFSRLWNAVLVLVSLTAMVTQLVLVSRGIHVLTQAGVRQAGVFERVVRFFSYFTIQSNILAIAMSAILMFRPDRDGRWWRIVRIASLVGMTVTFVVYLVALRPIVHLHGTAQVTDIGFHYVAPLMTMIGWLAFGPRPRIDPGSLLRHLIWPLGYIGYVLILGAVTGWYPYPFIDADQIGYGETIWHAGLVLALVVAVGGVYYWLDKVLDKVPTTAERTASLMP